MDEPITEIERRRLSALADKTYRSVLEASQAGDDADSRYLTALALARLNRPREAEKVCLDALRRYPDDALIKVLLIGCRIATGQLRVDDAIREMESISAAQPQLLAPRISLAGLYLGMSPEKASALIEQLSTEAPDHPEVRYVRGLAAFHARDFLGALREAEEIRRLGFPLSYRTAQLLMLSARFSNRTDAALDAYRLRQELIGSRSRPWAFVLWRRALHLAAFVGLVVVFAIWFPSLWVLTVASGLLLTQAWILWHVVPQRRPWITAVILIAVMWGAAFLIGRSVLAGNDPLILAYPPSDQVAPEPHAERTVMSLLNRLHLEHGLPPVRTDHRLVEAARRKSAQLYRQGFSMLDESMGEDTERRLRAVGVEPHGPAGQGHFVVLIIPGRTVDQIEDNISSGPPLAMSAVGGVCAGGIGIVRGPSGFLATIYLLGWQGCSEEAPQLATLRNSKS